MKRICSTTVRDTRFVSCVDAASENVSAEEVDSVESNSVFSDLLLLDSDSSDASISLGEFSSPSGLVKPVIRS